MNWNLKQNKVTLGIIKRLDSLNGAISVKRGRPVVNMFINMAQLLGWRGNLSLVKVIVVFASNASRIAKEQSIKGLVLQLKVAQVLLQQSMGGYKVPNVTLLGQRVSRNGQGLPRNWIPAIHRKHLRNGSHLHFKLWMTLFSLYRVLDFDGKLNLSSITDGSGRDFSFLLGEYSSFICQYLRPILLRMCRPAKVWYTGLSGDPLKAVKLLRTKPFIISSASPAVTKQKDVSRLGPDGKPLGGFSILSTSPAGILLSVLVWYRPANDQLRRFLFDWCKMTDNIWLINRFEQWVSKIPKGTFVDAKGGSLGKLACLPESAGKIRVVAMVDCWTQWLMEPLFKSIAALLRCIPQDGTEDQDKPYRLLWEKRPDGPFYCYDLSSATDRLPIIFQQALLSACFGSWFAQLWGILLIGRPYEIVQETDDPHNPFKKTPLYYATGQPMGAKSSFHMMALFHHTVVQWAAFRKSVCPGKWFEYYAIVGDDVVISDDRVAAEYLVLMDSLGVKVGLHKSLVSLGKVVGKSRRLCSEFIKRTYYSPHNSKRRGVNSPLYYDVSALPISQWYMATRSLAGAIDLARKYNLSLTQFLTLRGVGYKVKGKIMSKLSEQSRRVRHLILAYYSPMGVKPKDIVSWISMRSINGDFKMTVKKANSIISNILKSDAQEILRSMESPTFVEITTWAKELITVKRDREYYGTTERKADRINKFEDLFIYDKPRPGLTTYLTLNDNGDIVRESEYISDSAVRKHKLETNNFQWVLDQLIELVYREVYMDVIINIRDIRQEAEAILEEEVKGDDIGELKARFERLWTQVRELDSTLSGLPLPKEIYSRFNSEIKVRESKLVKSWERYTKIMGSTKSD